MKTFKPIPTKTILFLNGKQSIETFPNRSDAVAWAMSQSGLKRWCGHAMVLDQHGYVSFPGSKGWAKIIKLMR